MLRNELDVPDRACARLLMVEPPVGLTACYLVLGDFVLELLHFRRDGNAPPRERHFTEPGLTHLSLTVDDLAAACGSVADLGGEVLQDTDMGGRAILVRDPDGQLIELMPAPAR
jgi:catechol 2,3-dioxygenase-like lactoylglutathione lyase family enzyme